MQRRSRLWGIGGAFDRHQDAAGQPAGLAVGSGKMANKHFGSIGDIWKHLPLAEILEIERPRNYWESHASWQPPMRARCSLRGIAVPWISGASREAYVF